MAAQYTTRGFRLPIRQPSKAGSVLNAAAPRVNAGGQQANVNIAGNESRPEKPQKNTEFSIDSQFEGA